MTRFWIELPQKYIDALILLSKIEDRSPREQAETLLKKEINLSGFLSPYMSLPTEMPDEHES